MSEQSARQDLVISGVTKRFGGVTAVSEASFRVRAGRIQGLIGPNGAGKSTVLALISGFLRPDSGSILLGPSNLARMSPSSIARLGIARTFQQATPLVGLTVLENVLIGLHTTFHSGLPSILIRAPAMRSEERGSVGRANELLEQFGLANQAETNAGDLTFGKLRFLELARAVAMKPRILLLDEPAAGLNRTETDNLAELIRMVRSADVGVLVVDHDVPFVFSLCDEVTAMNFGVVIASGPAEEIYRDTAVREAYLGVTPVSEAS